ncbi:MAG TPA: enoyl-CoA hydratase-related protein [Thermoanaerobaculia bacterium]|nr:enoyl-CoA hydratase-related protein [Thermoanaerobaculia bacterium]
MTHTNFSVERRASVARVTLNRPEVHNAFNDELISEAIDVFGELSDDRETRVIVLAGSGANFCAGADLNWMARMATYTREENVRDSARLARMFAVINAARVPVVGRVQGAAIGGGVGLVAVCDIAIGTATSKFGLSEVKLGILPAVISPYVIAKIGESHARALFLTGERFGADRAKEIGLLHAIAADEAELDRMIEEKVSQLLSSGPEAVAECKKLIEFVVGHPPEESIPHTIEAIAERRASAEGQAGMGAFLKKEKPPWVAR